MWSEVCFPSHPGVAPQSLIQVIEWAVTSEGTSNRTSGLCSASQSLKDCDGLKFRPGKLINWTTRCHPSALGAWLPSALPRDPLRWLP